MPSAKARDDVDTQAKIALIESVCERIREHLENERHRVIEEIKKYPTPIAACDAQFNYLLEERARIAQELDQLKALAGEGLSRKAYLELIGKFIASSNYIDGEMAQKFRSSLMSGLDGGA